nr:hypothetical protein [Treponema sp.]
KLSKDGHLEADGKRIRIFGTNLSEFPTKKDAADYAKVLANQGYNCVRFHHTDADWTNCFIKRNENGKASFNEEAFDRFDYFFAELKKNGIYSNINFLTGRNIKAVDGYRSEIDSYSDRKSSHALGFWDSDALEDQKKYAETILNHINPYTGLAYKDDPAVAIVEINNENGLLMAYTTSWLECIDGYYWNELEDKFNSWLKANNYSYDKLAASFNRTMTESEVLIDNNSQFQLEEHQGGRAKVFEKDGVRNIAIQENGKLGWHVQYKYPHLNIKNDDILTLKFSIKAKKDCTISLSFTQDHSPWDFAGFYRKLNLTKEYVDYEITITDLLEDPDLRLCFSDMGFLKGNSISIKNCSLIKGGQVEYVKKGYKYTEADKSVKLPHFEEYKTLPKELKNIYMAFLHSQESQYWTSMKDFVRNDIGSQALIMGTALTCSTPYLQSVFDIIDSHAYWNHPVFPGRDWDNSDFYVWNKTQTQAKDDNRLFDLASQRVFGKPFSVSEYDHPYPNQYSGEGPLMLSSFASYQDWDCIFTFCSSVFTKNNRKVKITGFFDQTGNPAKTHSAPMAARIFRQGLVEPAEKIIYQSISLEDELNQLYNSRGWAVYNSDMYKLNRYISLGARIGLSLNGFVPDNAIKNEANPKLADDIYKAYTGSGYISDNKDLYWNASEGLYIICNDKVTITIAAVNAKPVENLPEWQKEGRLLPFVPIDDFIACAAIKEGKGSEAHYLISSVSWSGNKDEYLREYGSKSSVRNSVIRDQIKLTAAAPYQGKEALALASNASFQLFNSKGSLYPISSEGQLLEKISSNVSNFEIKADQCTLWYFLEF